MAYHLPQGIPTTTERQTLLNLCNGWLGQHYEGGDMPTAWHIALWETVGIPLGRKKPLNGACFTDKPMLDLLMATFGEVLALGINLKLYDQPDTAEAKIALAACETMLSGVQQPDLSPEQRHMVHLDSMVASVQHWLTHTEGGMASVTTDLFTLLHGGEPR